MVDRIALHGLTETVVAVLSIERIQQRFKVSRWFTVTWRFGTEIKRSVTVRFWITNGFQHDLGNIFWVIELGRIDIYLEISLLSQYQANPRAGHLEALYHVFAYLKNHLDMGRIAYDSLTPTVDASVFNKDADWTEFYGDVQEEIPPRMPKPRGKKVTVSAFVDANNAGNVVTRRSHMGIIIYVQNAPIIWYSKRQNTVEASTFGSELVALRVCVRN